MDESGNFRHETAQDLSCPSVDSRPIQNLINRSFKSQLRSTFHLLHLLSEGSIAHRAKSFAQKIEIFSERGKVFLKGGRTSGCWAPRFPRVPILSDPNKKRRPGCTRPEGGRKEM